MSKLQNLKKLEYFTGYAFVNTDSEDRGEIFKDNRFSGYVFINTVSKNTGEIFDNFNKSDLINAALLTSKDGKIESVRGTIRFYNGEISDDEDFTRIYEVIGSVKNGIIKLNHGWEFNE